MGGRDAVDNMEKRAGFKRVRRSRPSLRRACRAGRLEPGRHVEDRPCSRIEQEIILYDGIKRVDIVNRLKKERPIDPEAAYFAFPFRARGGQVPLRHRRTRTMAPETEQLPGRPATGIPSRAGSRRRGEPTIVWSPVEAPLVQFGDINTGKWLKKLDLKNAFVFSYALNNLWMTNFKASQGGAITFRYALTSRSGGADPVASTRFGWDVHSPLSAVWIPANGGKGDLSGEGLSFITLDKPNVAVQAVKAPAVGGGIVLRLRELAGRETRVRITIPGLKTATVAVEATDIAEGPANIATVIPGRSTRT